MSDTLEDVAQTMGKAREFVECNFLLGSEGGESAMSLPLKQALATWQSFHHIMINGPGQIVNRLLPIIRQCKVVEADSLKTNKIHMSLTQASRNFWTDSTAQQGRFWLKHWETTPRRPTRTDSMDIALNYNRK